jgi:hypothetical protein
MSEMADQIQVDIEEAIAEIARGMPGMAAHLRKYIKREGESFVYSPPPGFLKWDIDELLGRESE